MLFRRTILALTAACLLAAVVAPAQTADWTLGRYDCAGTGFTPETVSLPLAHCWQFNTFRVGKNSAPPVVANGVIYFCAGDRVVAMDAESGAVKWYFPADQPLNGQVRAAPAVFGDTLYVGSTDSKLYAVNIADGVLRWTYSTSGSIRSSLSISDNVVFFGSDDNSLHAVDVNSGESAWRGPFACKDDVAIPPAVSAGFVVFASSDGMLYGANCVSGAIRWQYRLPLVPSRSAPVISGDVVYIGAGNSLFALGLKTGKLRWIVPLSQEIAAGPAIGEEVASDQTDAPVSPGPTLYVISKAKKLYAVGPNGKSKWEKPVDLPFTCSVPPTISGDNVIVATDRGSICAYSAATGALRWSYMTLPAKFATTGGYTGISAPPVVANGRIYVTTDDGALHCFDSEMPDDQAPEVFSLAPARAVEMSGFPPINVYAVLYDLGSGVDMSGIQLSIDGSPVEHKYDVNTSTVSFATTDKKPDGRHEIALKARDWRGNEMTETWSFVVDNKLRPPAVPKAAPAGDSKSGTTPGAKNPPAPNAGTTGPGGRSDWRDRIRRPSENTGNPPTPPPPPPPAPPPPSGPTAPY